MSGGLPVLTGRKVIKALEQAHFIVHHTTGSHVILRHVIDLARRVTVPTHNRDLKPGTLRQIIKQSGLSVEEFNKLL
jgi:predicted RNA binding protein YcfA (HicA-like mRNA interferase family)